MQEAVAVGDPIGREIVEQGQECSRRGLIASTLVFELRCRCDPAEKRSQRAGRPGGKVGWSVWTQDGMSQ